MSRLPTSYCPPSPCAKRCTLFVFSSFYCVCAFEPVSLMFLLNLICKNKKQIYCKTCATPNNLLCFFLMILESFMHIMSLARQFVHSEVKSKVKLNKTGSLFRQRHTPTYSKRALVPWNFLRLCYRQGWTLHGQCMVNSSGSCCCCWVIKCKDSCCEPKI